MHNALQKHRLCNCNRDSHLHNYSKNRHPHICCRNCHLHMCCRNFLLHNCNRNSHLHNSNRKIHQHTSNRKYHLKTCINATAVVTCIFTIESVSCIVQITLKPSLAQKLKLIFKFGTIMGQRNVPLWTHMGHKGWRKNERIFIRCYTIDLKFRDEFNASFALLSFSSYSSIKMWHLYLRNVEKNNNAVHLKLALTYLFLNLFNTEKYLAWHSKKIVH